MEQSFLIADSGGTQTDWCYVDPFGARKYFTTSSFHPKQWDEQFIHDFTIYWKKHADFKSSKVVFYGAGCTSDQNKIRLKEIFLFWGFSHIEILSDIEGACHAALGNNKGVVAILGTGSVVCQFDGKNITQMNGGFGYLLGDEGSGYHFGKLVLQKLLNKEFSEDLTIQLTNLLGDRKAIISSVYGDSGKQFIGTIASKLSDLNQLHEIESVHQENLSCFFKRYVEILLDESLTLSIIGRYGFYQSDLIKKIFIENGWRFNKMIDSPIELITDYVLNDTF
jgi:hypothetical protein